MNAAAPRSVGQQLVAGRETLISGSGHSRRFGHTSAISGLPITADMLTSARFRQ
jgi:hypothetical protein